MSNFQWDPAQDQTYTATDGSQTVMTPTIDKFAGKSFTMDAEEQTLELLLPRATEVTAFSWGKKTSQPAQTTNIKISQGTFRISCPYWTGDDIGDSLVCNEDYKDTTNITLSGNGRLEFYNFMRITLGLPNGGSSDFNCNVNISDNSSLLIESAGLVTINSNLHINDKAEFKVFTESLNMGVDVKEGEQIVVSGTPDPVSEYSFFFQGVASPLSPVKVTSTTFKESSVSKFMSPNIFFLYNSIEDNARVFINTDSYDGSGVSLSKGSPELTIGPVNNASVFDLTPGNVTYPEGMFNFIKNNEVNNGLLTLSTNSNNGFGFQQMLSMKMIYINGSPATKEIEFNNDYSSKPGYMIIKLRNI